MSYYTETFDDRYYVFQTVKFDIDYIDVINYLKSLIYTFNIPNNCKNDRNVQYTKEDIYNTEKKLFEIIGLVNKKIHMNDYNKEHANISTNDGYEDWRRSMGLAPSLYKKSSYDGLIKIVLFSKMQIIQHEKARTITVNVLITRENPNSTTQKLMLFKISLYCFMFKGKENYAVTLLDILGINNELINDKRYENYNNFYKFKYTNEQMLPSPALLQELKNHEDYRTNMMQESIENLYV